MLVLNNEIPLHHISAMRLVTVSLSSGFIQNARIEPSNFLFITGSYSRLSAEDPANSFVPSASVTERPLHVLLPSLAR